MNDQADQPSEERLAAIAAELVEEVDRSGTVVRVVPRSVMRAEVLRHRCTYVVVMTSDEHIIVHQRADWKEVFPSFWDLAFGGVCGVGEKWELSAERELAEEAGLAVGTDTSALESLGSVAYEGDAGAVVGEAFVVISDVEPTCPDGEVVAIDRVPIAEIDGWLADRDVCPDSRDAVLPLLLNLKNS